jgi:Protein of unknown function (DUF2442)
MLPTMNGIQVTNIEQDGFWLLTPEGEYFVAFADYPDFTQAAVAQIHNFRGSVEGCHWPDLDIDIEMDALKHPERFPRMFKHND